MAINRRELLRIMAGGAAIAILPGCATRLRAVDAENEDVAELVKTVAYCGLVCGVCSKSVQERCKGCRSGGGTKNCYHRKCCIENGLDGCWQCEKFPCDNGYFADDNRRWRGLCVGSAQCVKDYGIESYVDRVVSRLGKDVEHAKYQYKEPQEIQIILCGD